MAANLERIEEHRQKELMKKKEEENKRKLHVSSIFIQFKKIKRFHKYLIIRASGSRLYFKLQLLGVG